MSSLTPAQRNVLLRMRQGWRLSINMRYDATDDRVQCALASDEFQDRVNKGTFAALLNRHMIEPVGSQFPLQRYRLTKGGNLFAKKIEEEESSTTTTEENEA